MGLSSQQVNSAPHGSSVLQRRRSSGAKRAGGRARALGAVRLKETQQVEEPAADAAGPRQELGDGSDTGTLHGKEENADALNSKPGSSEAKRQSPTSRFQDELARDGTTDRWFDEQMSTSQRRSSSGSAGAKPTAVPKKFGPDAFLCPGSQSVGFWTAALVPGFSLSLQSGLLCSHSVWPSTTPFSLYFLQEETMKSSIKKKGIRAFLRGASC